MKELEHHLSIVQEVASLPLRWRPDLEFEKLSKSAEKSYGVLKTNGLVYAAFPRSTRLEDYHTLPRDYVNTAILLNGHHEQIEIPANKKLSIFSAPVVDENGVMHFICDEGDFGWHSVLQTPNRSNTPTYSFEPK